MRVRYKPSRMRCLALIMVVWSGSAVAEPPDVPDPSMIPDASVGQGGAQQGNEESDMAPACTSDNDCDRGLRCVQYKCTWQQYRQATFRGCGGKAMAVAAIGLVFFARRRRRFNRVL